MRSSRRFARHVMTQNMAMFIAIALALALSAAKSYAQGINYPVGSPAGTSGTGNARTDPDNLFIRNNVAGMTEIPVNDEEEHSGKLGDSGKGGWRLTGELQESVYNYHRTFTQPGLGFGSTSNAQIFNPGLAGEMTYTAGSHKYAFGIGAYQIFGFQAKIVDNPEIFGSRATFFDTKVASNDLAFGGAVRLGKRLSVGGSFIFGRAFLDLKAPTAQLAFFGIIKQSRLDVTDIGGPGASVSVHFRPINRISFGFNYKSRRSYQLEGELETFELKFGPSGVTFPAVTRKVKADFDLPTIGEAGIQVKTTERLTLAFDFRYYHYPPTLKALSVQDRATGETLISRDVFAKDVRSVRFGGICTISDNTKVYFGSAFTSSGFPEAAINPGLINVGGVDISGGVGKRLFGQWVTFAAAGIFGRGRDVRPPTNVLFPGKYDGAGFLMSIGMRLRKK